MKPEIIAYGGWPHCARLVAGATEIVVTLDVGPRILRYGFVGGPNLLFEDPAELGKTGGNAFRSYGGHRLWIAPEDLRRTMQPDNTPVDWGPHGQGWVFCSATDRYGIQKELRVSVDQARPRFVIEHALRNHGPYALELAPWALTVMAPGGECLFPQAPYRPHSECILPARPLVLWSYTKMNDPRWTWGERVVRLRHMAELGGRSAPPQKVGARVEQGHAAYALRGQVFFKRFPFIEGACYPDMGCNFETFTRHDMLEVESLGPLQRVAPGATALHLEAWYLAEGQPPDDDQACAAWLGRLAGDRPL